jgi:hypothetical protein
MAIYDEMVQWVKAMANNDKQEQFEMFPVDEKYNLAIVGTVDYYGNPVNELSLRVADENFQFAIPFDSDYNPLSAPLEIAKNESNEYYEDMVDKIISDYRVIKDNPKMLARELVA